MYFLLNTIYRNKKAMQIKIRIAFNLLFILYDKVVYVPFA